MKNIYRILVALLVFTMIPMTQKAEAAKVIDEKLGVPIIALGANLSEDEKSKMLTLFDEDANSADIITISGQDLVKYIPSGNGNARMFSSAKITRKDEGHGLVIDIVTPKDITQVTAEMYATAMLTAGIEDAVVEVASPKTVTGHSALVGIYKAYEVAGEGAVLDPERTEVANEELNVLTNLAEKSGIDQDEVANLLTEIKKEVAKQAPQSKEEVEKIVTDQLSKLKIELSDADRQLIIDLMDKIRGLNIDFDKWSKQLDDVASKIKDKIGSIDSGFFERIKEFFASIFAKIKSWFS
ncbi:MAG TPA: DUF1002 domain-containing protein [Savagea sp.]